MNTTTEKLTRETSLLGILVIFWSRSVMGLLGRFVHAEVCMHLRPRPQELAVKILLPGRWLAAQENWDLGSRSRSSAIR